MCKLIRLLALFGAVLVPSLSLAESVLPAGSAGQVTMNWQKFDEIWTKMQSLEKKVEELEKPDNPPPVPFTITKAAYKGTVGTSKIAMTAAFELDIYEPQEWVKIPFLPSSVAITEARLDGEAIGVIQDSGFHHVVLKKPGRHVLRVAFALKAPKDEEAPQFHMAIQPTPMTVVAFEFPRPKLDVSMEPAQGVETRAVGSDRTLVTAALPPTSSLQVRWQKAATEEKAGPAKLYLDNQQLITVAEGTLKSHWGLNYSILHKGIREFRLQVPDSWNILAVNCDGMQEWKIVNGSKGPELLVQLAYARRGTLAVSVEAERGLREKEDVVEIPRLIPFDVEREQGSVGVEAKGAVELQVQSATGLHTIDPKELPAGLWQTASQPILHAFRYTKPYSLALAVTRHPEVAVLSTTIDDANGITVLTSRGQMITKIRYQVRNQLKQYLAVRLPKEAELWSAFVAGEPVKPTLAQDGTYRIPLAKSQLGDRGQQGFPVEMIYFRRVPKFLPAGYRSLALPMPDAPVSRMMWSLYLPEKYRFPHFGGDVEKGAMARPWNAIIGGSVMDSRHIAKNVPQAAPAKEQVRARDDLRQLASRLMGSKSKDAIHEVTYLQSEVAGDLFAGQDKAPTVAGIFPVAFDLPASGQLFNFGQVMIVGQDPTVSLVYLHASIIRTLVLLMLAGIGLMIYRRRDFLLKLLETQTSRIRSWIPANGRSL